MAAENREQESRDVSIKVRRKDYDTAQAQTKDFPFSFVSIFSAMTLLWEQTSEKKRLELLKQAYEGEQQSNAIAAA